MDIWQSSAEGLFLETKADVIKSRQFEADICLVYLHTLKLWRQIKFTLCQLAYEAMILRRVNDRMP